MPLQTSIFITFALLALAICTVWIRPVALSTRIAASPWSLIFVMAMAWGLASGVLSLPAVVLLILFSGAAVLATGMRQKTVRIVFGVITAVLAFALAIHRLPGFHNPVTISAAVFSTDAAPFTQYANFDKGSAGLILLAFLCRRTATLNELGDVLVKIVPVLLATLAAVMGLSMVAGYVRPDFKLPEATAAFLLVNLLFTVVAEEAFFRGLLQARLASMLAGWRYGPWIAIASSALLFGAAHLAGGSTYALLAAIAGFGYAYAYHATQRIEASIFIHFTVNAVHFTCFTYPYLAVA